MTSSGEKMIKLELTIIVPIYNVEEYLETCLNSLVDTRYTGRYVVLLVDDCGHDASRQIAQQYVDTHPNLFKLLQHEKNRGLSAARNTGLAYTTSQYVMFVDSDDWLSEGAISNLLNTLNELDPDFLFFDFKREWQGRSKDVTFMSTESNAKLLDESLYFSLLQKVPVTAWGKVFKTNSCRKSPFTEGIIFEDIAVIPSIIIDSKSKIYLPNVYYHYRQREGSIMDQNRSEIDKLFHSFNLLISDHIKNHSHSSESLFFVLLRSWIIYIRLAYREKDYKNSIEILDKGVSFFNTNNSNWTKNQYFLKHLSSSSSVSKIKTRLILSFIKLRVFKLIFILHINYKPINVKNIKPLIRNRSLTEVQKVD